MERQPIRHIPLRTVVEVKAKEVFEGLRPRKPSKAGVAAAVGAVVAAPLAQGVAAETQPPAIVDTLERVGLNQEEEVQVEEEAPAEEEAEVLEEVAEEVEPAPKEPIVYEGMYGAWAEEEVYTSPNGYEFRIVNNATSGIVGREEEVIARLAEDYGAVHGVSGFTVHFLDEENLSPQMKKVMIEKGWHSHLNYDDPDSDQILFYKSTELASLPSRISRYGRYDNFILFGTYRENTSDEQGNSRLDIYIGLFNRDKYQYKQENFEGDGAIAQRITEDILWGLQTGARTQEEFSRLVSARAGVGTEDLIREFMGPSIITRKSEYLFKVIV